MMRADRCRTCRGAGLVPGPGCACPGSVHTCIPRRCPDCPGSAIGAARLRELIAATDEQLGQLNALLFDLEND